LRAGYGGTADLNSVPEIQVKERKLKFPDIPVLENYETDPGKEFWDRFKFNLLPKKPFTRINIEELEALVGEVKASGKMSPAR